MKEYQVVLSIFKGENFVVKKAGGIQCKIIGKVNDSILESRVFQIATTCSEPDFNYQIAWKLNKKKFHELRLHRGNVRIECHQLTSDQKIESLIGYCLISIKEALAITSYEEIDVKNSKVLPLIGTKQPWLQYGPKLYCMLHFEDPSKVIACTSKRKMVLKNPPRKDQNIKAPLPPPPSATMASSAVFVWSTNNELGYFQLGEAGPSDDLYIMNITLIWAQHLKYLLTQKVSNLKYLDWKIVFNAFGIEISSDAFTVSEEDCDQSDCKNTYLGDKSTARIRANEQEFTKFLQHTVLELKVVTLKGETVELQGTAFVELEPLTNSEVVEIRSTIDIMPERAKIIPRQHKPQLSQIVDVKRSPNFFAKNYIKIEDICFPGANITTSKENIAELGKSASSMSNQAEVGAGDKSDTTERPEEIPVEPEIQLVEEQSYKDPLVNRQSFNSNGSGTKASRESKAPPEPTFPESGRSHESSSTSTSKSVQQKYDLPSPIKVQDRNVIPSPIKMPSALKMPKRSKVPPGNYALTMKFFGLSVKCRRPFSTDWLVVFHHPPLSVGLEDKSVIRAKPKEFQEHKRLMLFDFDDDETEKWVLAIPKITPNILESPLKVFFYGSSSLLDDDPIAFAHIPLGEIFTVDSKNNSRNIEGSVAIHSFRDKKGELIRVGYIGYNFTLEDAKTGDNVDATTSFISAISLKETEIPKTRDMYGNGKENSIEEWRAQEEKQFIEKLKEKEQAYFTILSAEHRKQKEESEKIVNEKLAEMEKMKLELDRKMRFFSEKEEKLKQREFELHESTRSSEFHKQKELEELKLKIRTMEADKNTEIKSLKRQLDDAADLLKIANEKNRCLEIKVATKDNEIATLMSNRNQWPDLEALVKIEKLEHEIDQLKKSLKRAQEERDSYRGQNQKVIKALQQQSEDSKEQLRSENENLKLQMFATREHEVLSIERKQVEDISHEIRRLQRSSSRHTNLDHRPEKMPHRSSVPATNVSRGYNSHLPAHKTQSTVDRDALLEQEIERLTRSREGLLKTQAYTKYDPLIREIEQEILRNIQLRAELQHQED